MEKRIAFVQNPAAVFFESTDSFIRTLNFQKMLTKGKFFDWKEDKCK